MKTKKIIETLDDVKEHFEGLLNEAMDEQELF